MSTPGADNDASFVHKQYFCYECNRTVLIAAPAPAAGELSCPECRVGGAFLEEDTVDAPSIHSFPFTLLPTAAPSSSSFSTAAPPSNLCNFITNFLDIQDGSRGRSRSGSGAASATGAATPENEPESFDRLAFFQNYIHGLEQRGAIDVLFDGERVNFAFDSFMANMDGPSLENLMEQLMENHPNHRGTPPATKSALSLLPDVVLTDAMVAAAEGAECVVCKDDFSPGDEAKKMPCNHIYHVDCIIRWLELHNSCPICRFELLTDDPDYEGKKASNQQPTVGMATVAASMSSGNTEEGEGQTARVVERRLNGLGEQTAQQDGNNGGAPSSSRDSGSQDGDGDSNKN